MADHQRFHVAHATPRRLRLQAPHRRGDRLFFLDVRERLAQWPNVERVDVNPISTSVVIHSSDARAILDLLESNGMLRVVESPAPEPEKRPPAPATQARLYPQLRQWSGGRVNLARISVFAVVGVSVAVKLARGNNVAAAAMILLYGGRAAQRWWIARQDGTRAAAPLAQLLSTPGGP